MRQAMHGKALEIVMCLDRDELKGEGGATRLLNELDKYYYKIVECIRQ